VHLDELPTPALVIDLDRLERNIAAMARRARDLGVSLRPHVKSHKCVEIAHLQAEAGAAGFTVATPAEARFLVDAGYRDITWAVPLSEGHLGAVRELAERASASIGVLVDSTWAVQVLEASGRAHEVWLKVDCGYHRAGVDPQSGEATELARLLATSHRLRFRGLLTHSGHAYDCRSPAELAAVAEQERAVMTGLAGRLAGAGIDVPEISVGSTPAMSAVAHLEGVSETRPGNYVFYDATQAAIGSCSTKDCALSVLATVISRRAGEQSCWIDAGALALGKDRGADDLDYGGLWADYRSGMVDDSARITSLSQEHGRISCPADVGSRVRVEVQHACLTTACYDRAWVARDDEVVASWPIHRER
jgi:D-serine deaminase-like pyridoxal phosphate-dependent protein